MESEVSSVVAISDDPFGEGQIITGLGNKRKKKQNKFEKIKERIYEDQITKMFCKLLGICTYCLCIANYLKFDHIVKIPHNFYREKPDGDYIQRQKGLLFYPSGHGIKSNTQQFIKTNGNCCFNHIVGLPVKNDKEYPISIFF